MRIRIPTMLALALAAPFVAAQQEGTSIEIERIDASEILDEAAVNELIDNFEAEAVNIHGAPPRKVEQ